MRIVANDDEGQYREMGVLLWRGFTYDDVMAQCFGNCEDTSTKGKQMPVVPPSACSSSPTPIDSHINSSTLVQGSTTSTPFRRHWRPRYHKLLV